MGTTLTGKQIQATYDGLLKTTDNAAIDGTLKRINDGLGNPCPLYLSATEVAIDSGSFVVDTDTFVVDQVNNRVGIGTVAPQQGLHLASGYNLRLDSALYDGNNSPGSAGLVLSSTGSGVDWIPTMDNFRVSGDAGPIVSLQDNMVLSVFGTKGITTTTALSSNITIEGTDFSTFRQVDEFSGFTHSTANPSVHNYAPLIGLTVSTVPSEINAKVMPYAGRVRKIIMSNVPGGSLPSGGSTATIRVVKNSSILYTSSPLTIQGPGGGQYVILDLGDNDATFAAADVINFSFVTDSVWQKVGMTFVFEYTNTLI